MKSIRPPRFHRNRIWQNPLAIGSQNPITTIKSKKKTNCFVFQHLKAVKDARIDLKKIVGDDIGFGYL